MQKQVLRGEVPQGEALRAVAAEILAEARRALGPENTDAVAVHDFRKAMKRWRALLRLLAPVLGKDAEQLRVAARDLARELASARDVRAALDALADLGADAPTLSARSLATIKQRLEDLGARTESVSLTAAMRARIGAMLSEAEAAVGRWPLDQVGAAEIAAGLAEGYRRARRARPEDWSESSPEELHTLRRRVVAHRYQMELVEPLWPKFGRFWVGEAQRLRERLGHHHDLEVLVQMAAAHQPLAAWRSRLTPLIEARKQKHVAAASRLTGRLFAEKPKNFRLRMLALWKHGTGGE
jgi:CHAD domain-containing protein